MTEGTDVTLTKTRIDTTITGTSSVMTSSGATADHRPVMPMALRPLLIQPMKAQLSTAPRAMPFMASQPKYRTPPHTTRATINGSTVRNSMRGCSCDSSARPNERIRSFMRESGNLRADSLAQRADMTRAPLRPHLGAAEEPLDAQPLLAQHAAAVVA